MTKQLRKQIEKTINVLETKGWCQGDFHRKIHGQDHYCLLGAFIKANKGVPYGQFVDTFESQFETVPTRFNDKPHQKKSRVIGALRRLIQD